MVFGGFRGDSFFSDELYRVAEEIVEEPPFSGIEVIEEKCDTGDYLSTSFRKFCVISTKGRYLLPSHIH
jgi:hypothetical protein